MAYFELWPQRSDPKFSSDGGAPQLGMNYPFLTQNLRLNVLEHETVALSGQPNGVKLLVKGSNPVVKIERVSDPALNVTVDRLTGSSQGTSLLEARQSGPGAADAGPSGVLGVMGALASLNVTVTEADEATQRRRLHGWLSRGFHGVR